MRRILLLAALAANLCAAPGHAAPRVKSVGFADLDLTTRGGVRTLDRRIASAIKEACGTMSDADPAGKNAVRRCRKDAALQVVARRDQVVEARAARRYAERR